MSLKDLKEGLSSTRKPDLTHVRTPFMVYTARACELGNVRYCRSNFLRTVNPLGQTGIPCKEDFNRYRSYLRACLSHVALTLDAMEAHQANDPDLLDVEGMKTAAYAADTDVSPESKIGASGLPHVSPACSSLMMAISQAVQCGLLPGDPGQPWVKEKVTDLPDRVFVRLLKDKLVVVGRYQRDEAQALASYLGLSEALVIKWLHGEHLPSLGVQNTARDFLNRER